MHPQLQQVNMQVCRLLEALLGGGAAVLVATPGCLLLLLYAVLLLVAATDRPPDLVLVRKLLLLLLLYVTVLLPCAGAAEPGLLLEPLPSPIPTHPVTGLAVEPNVTRALAMNCLACTAAQSAGENHEGAAGLL